ncbi:unnamed protein product [Peronospora destructor]|uniref:Uncharacterized protein n=1 Tax=Peronospora destructor TaxID=86335 RepID=A0AAV0TW75_9STRA|nr:unnamed protein product [Peronospora destructor]
MNSLVDAAIVGERNAVLVEKLKDELAADVLVVGFEGSYGGMLGTWLRMKDPPIIDGRIADLAPVTNFDGDPNHVDTEIFDRIVTFDMSKDAEAALQCILEPLTCADVNALKLSDDIIHLASEAYGSMAKGD